MIPVIHGLKRPFPFDHVGPPNKIPRLNHDISNSNQPHHLSSSNVDSTATFLCNDMIGLIGKCLKRNSLTLCSLSQINSHWRQSLIRTLGKAALTTIKFSRVAEMAVALKRMAANNNLRDTVHQTFLKYGITRWDLNLNIQDRVNVSDIVKIFPKANNTVIALLFLLKWSCAHGCVQDAMVYLTWLHPYCNLSDYRIFTIMFHNSLGAPNAATLDYLLHHAYDHYLTMPIPEVSWDLVKFKLSYDITVRLVRFYHLCSHYQTMNMIPYRIFNLVMENRLGDLKHNVLKRVGTETNVQGFKDFEVRLMHHATLITLPNVHVKDRILNMLPKIAKYGCVGTLQWILKEHGPIKPVWSSVFLTWERLASSIPNPQQMLEFMIVAKEQYPEIQFNFSIKHIGMATLASKINQETFKKLVSAVLKHQPHTEMGAQLIRVLVSSIISHLSSFRRRPKWIHRSMSNEEYFDSIASKLRHLFQNPFLSQITQAACLAVNNIHNNSKNNLSELPSTIRIVYAGKFSPTLQTDLPSQFIQSSVIRMFAIEYGIIIVISKTEEWSSSAIERSYIYHASALHAMARKLLESGEKLRAMDLIQMSVQCRRYDFMKIMVSESLHLLVDDQGNLFPEIEHLMACCDDINFVTEIVAKLSQFTSFSESLNQKGK
jgi:hypothetical protein